VVGGGPPRCKWAPTNTVVVHHRPLRVYNERHFNVIDYTSQPWPLTITIPLRFWTSSLSSSFVRFEEPKDPWLSLPRFVLLLHHSSSNDTCLLQRLVLEPSHWQALRDHFLTIWQLYTSKRWSLWLHQDYLQPSCRFHIETLEGARSKFKFGILWNWIQRLMCLIKASWEEITSSQNYWSKLGQKWSFSKLDFSFINRCAFPWAKFPSHFFSWIDEGMPQNVKPKLWTMASRTVLIPC